MSHDVTFDLVNLVMSETGVPKKFRLNNFLKKKSHCPQIAGYFCSRRCHRKRYSKKEMESPKLAWVASVSVRFRSKERGTRVKDCAKNGASKRAGRGGEESFLPSPPSPPSFIFWLSFHFSGGQNWSFFAPKPNENSCYAGYT